jgi:hypothetical protein
MLICRKAAAAQGETAALALLPLMLVLTEFSATIGYIMFVTDLFAVAAR